MHQDAQDGVKMTMTEDGPITFEAWCLRLGVSRTTATKKKRATMLWSKRSPTYAMHKVEMRGLYPQPQTCLVLKNFRLPSPEVQDVKCEFI